MEQTSSIQHLFSEGYLSAMDFYFAKRLNDLESTPSENKALAFAFAHRAKRMGHICYQLGQDMRISLKKQGKPIELQFDLPERQVWMEELQSSTLVTSEVPTTNNAPIVMDKEGRLYLSRYFDYQARLAEEICHRLPPSNPLVEKDRKSVV